MKITILPKITILFCSIYRPPSVHSDWIDLFETELSIAQATGLELILMGDFNIDLNACSNSKFLNMLQIFDLTQFIQMPTHRLVQIRIKLTTID